MTFEGVRGYLGPEQVFDAEEFFQARRDAELGRWRWPANPDYVVYAPRDFTHYVRIVNERDAFLEVIHRTSLEGRGSLMAQAARAYFEAHPERNPWQDAQPGELWVIVLDGEDQGVIVEAFEPGENVFQVPDAESVSLSNPRITAGRRIWPGDAS